jgi:hypothetical protein
MLDKTKVSLEKNTLAYFFGASVTKNRVLLH